MSRHLSPSFPSPGSKGFIRYGLILLAMALALPNMPTRRVQAAAGDLDPTYGANGKVVVHLAQNADPEAVKVQADGKAVIAGVTLVYNAAANDYFAQFLVMRFETNGAVDASFGTNGAAVTGFFGRNDVALDLAIQPDGKIVAVGQTENRSQDFALARYNPDGSLDSTFGSGGKVVTDFSGSFDGAQAVALQTDGKIIAAGFATAFGTGSDFALARYNLDGSLDNTFGTGGKATSDFSGDSDVIAGLAVQPDGKIVAAGGAAVGPFSARRLHFALARYNSDGSLDPAFGTGGKLTADFGTFVSNFSLSDEASDVALQRDGKIVAAGPVFTDKGVSFVVARFNADGSSDTNFGSGGKVRTDFANNSFAKALAIQADNRILVAGSTFDPEADFDFALVRYTTNGSLDPSFGTEGKRTTDFGGRDELKAITLQADGKILVAGRSQTDGVDIALARYNNDVSNFNICIQDESNDNLLQINTTTGEYQFTNCAGLTIGGTGTLTKRGNQITLQHNASDRRVMASLDTSTKRATASVQLLSQGRTFSITDRNITNNTCACR